MGKSKRSSTDSEVAAICSSQELENLKRVFNKIDTKKDGKIDAAEIKAALQSVHYEPKKNEVEDMIWEVDEDCDRMVNWEEFAGMFVRCRKDRTGCEPRKLFNMVEFFLYDRDGSGDVSVDECMRILFTRYGRHMLESEIRALFPDEDVDINKSLSYEEYLKQVTTKVGKSLLPVDSPQQSRKGQGRKTSKSKSNR